MGGDLLFHKQVQYHQRCEASAWLRYLFTNSFFFNLIQLFYLLLLSLTLSLPTLELFRLDYLQLSHLHLHSSAVPLSCRPNSINGSGFWALFTQKANSPLLWLLKRRHGLRAPLKSN